MVAAKINSASGLTVAGIQFLHEEGRRDANIQRATDLIRSCPGHDIYVLPELSCSGYGLETFRHLDELSEDLYGPSYAAFSDLAKSLGCFICYSFPRRAAHRSYTICAAVVDPSGKIAASYDKWHICQYGECIEKDYFTVGSGMPAVFDVNGIRVGICICYDIRFPEMIRKLTLEGKISLLLHPGGWPRDESFLTWHSFVSTRAIENSIYIMSPNRAGSHNGCSIFCPPFVDYKTIQPQTLGDEEGVLTGQVDMRYLHHIRSTYTLLKDRRTDLY